MPTSFGFNFHILGQLFSWYKLKWRKLTSLFTGLNRNAATESAQVHLKLSPDSFKELQTWLKFCVCTRPLDHQALACRASLLLRPLDCSISSCMLSAQRAQSQWIHWQNLAAFNTHANCSASVSTYTVQRQCIVYSHLLRHLSWENGGGGNRGSVCQLPG